MKRQLHGKSSTYDNLCMIGRAISSSSSSDHLSSTPSTSSDSALSLNHQHHHHQQHHQNQHHHLLLQHQHQHQQHQHLVPYDAAYQSPNAVNTIAIIDEIAELKVKLKEANNYNEELKASFQQNLNELQMTIKECSNDKEKIMLKKLVRFLFFCLFFTKF